jgi:integrase
VDRDASGKRQTRYVTFRGNKKEAEAHLTKLLNDANRGVLPKLTRLTLGEHLNHWHDGKDDLSPLTRQHYAEIIATQINPGLGHIELQKLTPLDVKNWLVAVKAGKRGQRSARTILRAYRLLHAALEAGVKLDMIGSNVADNVPAPKPIKSEVPIFKGAELQFYPTPRNETIRDNSC